jgi:prepilin-type N-terminal cleavage/methylation domain-containing protein/prepilin-type processing-associated H-X9-DG protein
MRTRAPPARYHDRVMTARHPRPHAFTLMEVLVVIGIIGLLMAILIPVLEKVRHDAYIAKCAANLHTIGQSLALYAHDNHGNYPRTTYVPGAALVAGTGGASADPFAPGGPQPNDTSAVPFLLMRKQKLPQAVLVCPYNDETSFEADKADPQTRSNFTDYRKNLGYSFANAYPDAAAEGKHYRWGGTFGSTFAVAGDLNPNVTVAGLTPTSPRAQQTKANSVNHEGDGQNVLYGDGHVTWRQTIFAGVSDDNVYANRPRMIGSPGDKDDSVLVPTK